MAPPAAPAVATTPPSGHNGQMKSANLSVVKDDLSGFVERARRGQVVRILVRGRPAADLVPIAADDADDESARMAALERAGVLRRARRPMTDDVFKKGPRPRRGGSIVDALLAERASGR